MQRVGPYVVERELARGGQGAVLAAADPRTGRPVAVKVLHDVADPVALRRFEQEARVLARLAHPSLVRVVDAGVDRGLPYLAMERIEGEDLGAMLRRAGPPPAAWTARTLAAVARAVEACHAAGVVHRDIKPQNIIVEHGTDRPVLVDFGLLRRDPSRRSVEGERLSRTGEVLGTPSFMPPEQADAGGALGPVGPAADVYALGATLYALLTGEPPFTGATALAVLARVFDEAPRPPRALAPATPPELEALCLACLRKRPEERPPTAAAVAEALEGFAAAAGRRRRRSPRRRPAALTAAGAAALALGLALAAVAARPRPAAPAAPPLGPPAPPAPPAASDAPPPWGAPPAGWRTAWRLRDAPAVRAAPELWAAPDTAAPLEAVARGEAAALAAAFAGRVRPLEGGRVAVTYDAVALRLRHKPGHATTAARPPGSRPPLVPGPGPAAFELFAPDDAGPVEVLVGAARWRDGRLDAAFRERTRVDPGQVSFLQHQVTLLWYGRGARTSCGLYADGRAERLLGVNGAIAVASRRFAWGAGGVALGLAPWDASPPRAWVDGAPAADLLAVDDWEPPPAPGAAAIRATEAHLACDGLEVAGTPVRVDRPALAAAPGWAPGDDRGARIAGWFDDPPGEASGPVLALGAALLEVQDGQARLSVDGEVVDVAAVDGPPAAGWASLERRGPVLRARAVVGAATAELEAVSPSPALEAGGPPGFGSSGARARWREVTVDVGPAPPAPGEAQWAAAARDLDGLLSPSRFDPDLAGRGPAACEAHRARADRAARTLRAAAEGLDGPLAVDALARATVASALAADAPAAEAALAALRGRVAGGARAAVDGLVRAVDGAPALVADLLEGWHPLNRQEEGCRAAILTLALAVAPDGRGTVLQQRAGDARLDERYAQALALYAEAEAAGADPRAFVAFAGDCHNRLGQFEDALREYDRALSLTPGDAFNWLGRGQALEGLGRVDDALAAYVGAVACAPLRPQMRQALDRLLGPAPASPTSLLARHLLGVRDPAQASPAVAGEARRLLAGAAPRDQDLLAYILGEAPPPGDRPTRLLALARRGDPAAQAGLAEAGRQDPLVAHAAALDPALGR